MPRICFSHWMGKTSTTLAAPWESASPSSPASMLNTTMTRAGITPDQTSPLRMHSHPLTPKPWQLLHLVRLQYKSCFSSRLWMVTNQREQLDLFTLLFFASSCTRHNFSHSIRWRPRLSTNLCHPANRLVTYLSPFSDLNAFFFNNHLFVLWYSISRLKLMSVHCRSVSAWYSQCPGIPGCGPQWYGSCCCSR